MAETSTSKTDVGPEGSGLASAPPKLSEELQRLIDAFEERSVQLREVLEVTQGRGYTMLLIVLAIPFCTPIPMPVFSLPFGAVMAVVGLRLALGQKPWLPSRLLDTRLPPRFFPRLLAATRRLVRFLEAVLKPRLGHLFDWGLTRRVIGAMIMVCGLLMVLPLPIPFSNGLPAMTIVLLSAGMLQQDGYVAAAGTAVFVFTMGFFAALGWGGAEVWEFVRGVLGR